MNEHTSKYSTVEKSSGQECISIGSILELTLGSLSSGPQNFIIKFCVVMVLSAPYLSFNFPRSSNLALKGKNDKHIYFD